MWGFQEYLQIAQNSGRDAMGLPRSATKSLWPLVALTVISWIVELCGLLSLHRCKDVKPEGLFGEYAPYSEQTLGCMEQQYMVLWVSVQVLWRS